jgi:TetR/AcrR family transcriptional repressor of nem operon
MWTVRGRPKEFDRSDALASATDCFWANGYESASITDLLVCMGIGRQSAYDTFGDKRRLFETALEAYADRVGSEMRRILTDARESPLGRVRGFLRRLAEMTSNGDGRGCLITNTIVELAPHDGRIRSAVSEKLRGLEGAIAANLRAAAKAGELPAGVSPGPAAKLVVAVMQGALVLSKTDLKSGLADAVGLAETLLCGGRRGGR